PLWIGVRQDDLPVLVPDEPFLRRTVEERQEWIVEPADIQQAAALSVKTELRPGHDLAELLECAEAARHGDESIGEVSHHRLPFVHGAHDTKIGEAAMRDF